MPHGSNPHAATSAALAVVVLLAASILKLAPDHPALALIPPAAHGLLSGCLAVRHHRRQQRVSARFNRGMPIKHGHGTHGPHGTHDTHGTHGGNGRGRP